jgi:membrane-associated protein
MIDFIKEFLDFVLHMNEKLPLWVAEYHTWTYLILFTIIFCETGLVVTPFLPGDSLLFATGAVAAMPGNPLNIGFIIILLFSAALIGDNTNYFIGKFLGEKVYQKNYRLIKREYLLKTHEFYEKHGGKTLIIARFMPIIRTFAPFVAGVGKMTYQRFILFCLLGNFLWVTSFSLAGFFFGNIPFIQKNFTMVIFAIIIISVLPSVYAVLKTKFGKKNHPSN